MSEWEQIGKDPPWYRRDVRLGPHTISLEVWLIQEHPEQWAFAYQGGRVSQPIMPHREKAVRAAEGMIIDAMREVITKLGGKP